MIGTPVLDPIAIFLLDATIKTSLFMGLVLLAVWLLGTRQAAKRSLLLNWCLVGVLVIPIASLCMPSLRFQFDMPSPSSEPGYSTRPTGCCTRGTSGKIHTCIEATKNIYRSSVPGY